MDQVVVKWTKSFPDKVKDLRSGDMLNLIIPLYYEYIFARENVDYQWNLPEVEGVEKYFKSMITRNVFVGLLSLYLLPVEFIKEWNELVDEYNKIREEIVENRDLEKLEEIYIRFAKLLNLEIDI